LSLLNGGKEDGSDKRRHYPAYQSEEAMSAARIAGKLLEEHGLAMSDIEIKERSDCEKLEINTGRKRAHEIQYCMAAIAAYCDCKCWMSGSDYRLFGFPEDVQTAKWLYDTVFNSMAFELSKFKIKTGMTSKRDSHSFKLGMALRVSRRLYQMKREQEQDTKETTGRDLVVVKSQVVETQLAQTGVRLRSTRSNTRSGSHAAYISGQAAGDRVGFGRGVGQQKYIS
jgi:hypothetical protein